MPAHSSSKNNEAIVVEKGSLLSREQVSGSHINSINSLFVPVDGWWWLGSSLLYIPCGIERYCCLILEVVMRAANTALRGCEHSFTFADVVCTLL